MERSNTLSKPPSRQMERRSPKRRLLALLLCVFFAPFHRFYVGKFWTGFLFFLTAGGFGIWWIIDIFNLARGRFEDSEGRVLGPPREQPQLDPQRSMPGEHRHQGDDASDSETPEEVTSNDWVVETDEGDEVSLEEDELMGDPLEKEFEELEKEYDRQQD